MRSRLLVPAISVGLVALAAASALAATTSAVVPRTGTVAGLGYARWLEVATQIELSGPPKGLPVCETRNTALGPVTMLFKEHGPGTKAYTCAVPASQPIYVIGLSTECSTVQNAPSHANTPAQLKACARKNYKGAVATASVDGQRVVNYRKLVAATPAFAFHLPKNNVFGSKKLTGVSAAYGEGLLLRGLPAGTHTVKVTGVLPGFKALLTYTLRVH